MTRINNDYYPTPRECIIPLLEYINFGRVRTFLEPCKGDGRILDLIPNNINKFWAEIDEGVDYLSTPFSNIDLIITNPPFSLSMEFITKSLSEAYTVIYLQRLNWLGSQSRKEFWNNNTPDKIFVLAKRPQFRKELGLEKGTDATEYAWFVWDRLNIVKGKHIQVI